MYELAINELEAMVEFVKANIPFNEAEGDVEQAELEREVAKSCQAAIELLKQNENTEN